jgi:hypothetical protein
MVMAAPTAPTPPRPAGAPKTQQNKGCPDRPDRPDRKSKGGGENDVSLSALAARWRVDLDHDTAEAEAMAEHYAAPAGLILPGRDPLAEGLLRGFWAHRRGTAA